MFKDKNILLIGGTGTIGQAMVLHLLSYKPNVVRIFSRDEYKQFIMKERLGNVGPTRFLLGDVRDKERLLRAMNNIDIVFNLAALKHVPACEYDPYEAVKTNVIGTQNVIDCALETNVSKVIYTSSDKAVSPTNTMGATKLLAERLISAANHSKGNNPIIFSSVRFGNVIGSRGSVIPLWLDQLRKTKTITITEPEMTRFMMSIEDAVELMLKASKLATGGETFVLKMPVIRLQDLADAVIQSYTERENIDVQSIQIIKNGLRAGEKMYEELLTFDEALYTVEYDDMFAIQPFIKEIKESTILTGYLSSEQRPLPVEDIKRLLKRTLSEKTGETYEQFIKQ